MAPGLAFAQAWYVWRYLVIIHFLLWLEAFVGHNIYEGSKLIGFQVTIPDITIYCIYGENNLTSKTFQTRAETPVH